MWAGADSSGGVVGREGIEPPQSKTADLQSAELTTCSTYPWNVLLRAEPRGGARARHLQWSRRRDSNPEPAVYKTAALPIELRRRRTANEGCRSAGEMIGRAAENRSSAGGLAARRPSGPAARSRRSGGGRSPPDRRPGSAGWRSSARSRSTRIGRRRPASFRSTALGVGRVPAPRWLRRLVPCRASRARRSGLAASRPASLRLVRLGGCRRGGSGRRRAVGRGGRRRSRCATASNRSTDPATAAFSEPTRPRIGMRTTGRCGAGRRAEARALAADDERERPAQVGLAHGQRSVRVGADDPEAAQVEVDQGPRQVVDRHEQQVLGRARPTP